MKYSHQSAFHTWNEFYSALSLRRLMPSLTWLFNLSQDLQRDLLEPVHSRQHLTDWAFSSYFSFLYSLVNIQKQLQERQEVTKKQNPYFCFDQGCRGGCSCISPRRFCDAGQLSTLLLLPAPSGLTWMIMAQKSWRGVHRFW